jgi:DNA recombination protein RmuC
VDALQQVSTQLIQTADTLIEKHGKKAESDVIAQKEEIKTILKPVEESIKRLDKHVEDTNNARTQAEALLNDQVQRLAGASESLTTALRKPVVRGSWGEMTLENTLESAGLEPGVDYLLQHTTDAADGAQRTDAVVNLPKGKKLIIDSKNLMQTFLALQAASDPAERELRIDAHSKALRGHIKSLAAKEYWRRYDGLDCVIMFIPHDGMYHAAIQDEAELIREASEKRVFIANPMTLIPLLKAVRYVLDQERLNKSAEDISKIGTELYADITRFAEKMSLVGERIEKAVDAYNDSIPALDRFIVSKSRRLKQLGAAQGADAALPIEIDSKKREFASLELKALAASASDDAKD